MTDGDGHQFDWEPRGEPGSGRGWNLPPGKECAERFLPPPEKRGPTGGMTDPTPDEVFAVIAEKYASGDVDRLDGGVAVPVLASHFEITTNSTRDRVSALLDDGRIVEVYGAAPETPPIPRKSYIPAGELSDDPD